MELEFSLPLFGEVTCSEEQVKAVARAITALALDATDGGNLSLDRDGCVYESSQGVTVWVTFTGLPKVGWGGRLSAPSEVVGALAPLFQGFAAAAAVS